MFYKTILIWLLPHIIQCSLVLDALNHHGIHVSEYCPKMKYCPEGAHVMCMYYNPNRVMGAQCRNARNVSMTPELANKMLDVSNAVRSKIARGMEKGKNGERFPRGYGMFRLKWDSELATFAQVLANQCVLRHDLCRATKKFPDPGQTAGLVRFSVPDWIPVSKSGNFSATGLNDEKLMYAAEQTLKSWYGQKSFVTVQMLTNYPDWSKDPNNLGGRLYLEMIYGSATHMGCGISAYTDYAYYDNDAALNYNSVQVICNYSARPRSGVAVFNTVPPSDGDNPFNSCGCPSGTMEDDDCLCLEIERETESPMQLHHEYHSCPTGVNCDPTVVLLPIFTVEDAPPERLITREKLANRSLSRTLGHTEIIDSFEELFYNNIPKNKRNFWKSRKNITAHPTTGRNGQKERTTIHKNKSVTVRGRHFDKKTNEPKHHEEQQNEHEDTHSRKKMQSHLKSSVFAKTPRFELPASHIFLANIKRNVVPRKDFTEAKKLVNKYLNDKNSIKTKLSKFSHSFERLLPELNDVKSMKTVSLNSDFHNYLHPNLEKKKKFHIEDVHFHDILTTETILNTAEQRIINENKYLNDFYPSHDFYKPEANTATEDSDKKFMALLDTLEQEVKHIELRENEKLIFDAKIKKIYGTVVGKSSNALTNTDKPIASLNTTENGAVQHFKKSENKQRFTKRIKKKQNRTDKNNFAFKLETRPNKLENGNSFDDEIYVSEKYPKQDSNDIVTDELAKKSITNIQKLRVNYPSRDTSKNYSNDIATEDLVKNSMLIDTNVQMDYDRDNTPRQQSSNDIVMDDFVKKSTSKDLLQAYGRRVKPNIRRNMNNVRQMNHNEINSLELLQYRYDNGYNGRKSYRNDNFVRDVIRNNEKPKHRSSSLDYRPRSKNYYGNNAYEDPLSVERRKYYQAKLNSMERKLQETRRNSRRKDVGRPRHMRTMRNNVGPDSQMNSIYTSGRARFLHGY